MAGKTKVQQPTDWKKTADALFRLGRFHTFMGYCMFTSPAMYTIALYHGRALKDGLLTPWEAIAGATKLSISLSIVMMAYRAAGMAWDDFIDRNLDAQVARSKTRPLAAKELSLTTAIIYILVWTGITDLLSRFFLPTEATYVNYIGWFLFFIYPMLKYVTYWAQLGGGILLGWCCVYAWYACSAAYEPTGVSGWESVAAIAVRDWKALLPIYMVELIYTLAHETVYGCQDTADDIKFGVFSTSILFGYKGGKRFIFPFILMYIGLLYNVTVNANLHALILTAVPAYIFLSEWVKLDMSDTKSCFRFAIWGIKAKLFTGCAFLASLAVKAAMT